VAESPPKENRPPPLATCSHLLEANSCERKEKGDSGDYAVDKAEQGYGVAVDATV
jgi:hypothetical protein